MLVEVEGTNININIDNNILVFLSYIKKHEFSHQIENFESHEFKTLQ